MNKELKLKELKAKKHYHELIIARLDKYISKLTDEVADDRRYKDSVKNKYCIVCANRIPEHDYKIPDGIVCGHPSNQEGKNKFQCTSHTCEHWKQETK